MTHRKEANEEVYWPDLEVDTEFRFIGRSWGRQPKKAVVVEVIKGGKSTKGYCYTDHDGPVFLGANDWPVEVVDEHPALWDLKPGTKFRWSPGAPVCTAIRRAGSDVPAHKSDAWLFPEEDTYVTGEIDLKIYEIVGEQ